MSDTTLWIKLRDAPRLSWHIATGRGVTTERIFVRCGREIVYYPCPSAYDLPMGERSCETCLRLTEHDAEKASGS